MWTFTCASRAPRSTRSSIGSARCIDRAACPRGVPPLLCSTFQRRDRPGWPRHQSARSTTVASLRHGGDCVASPACWSSTTPSSSNVSARSTTRNVRRASSRRLPTGQLGIVQRGPSRRAGASDPWSDPSGTRCSGRFDRPAHSTGCRRPVRFGPPRCSPAPAPPSRRAAEPVGSGATRLLRRSAPRALVRAGQGRAWEPPTTRSRCRARSIVVRSSRPASDVAGWIFVDHQIGWSPPCVRTPFPWSLIKKASVCEVNRLPPAYV